MDGQLRHHPGMHVEVDLEGTLDETRAIQGL